MPTMRIVNASPLVLWGRQAPLRNGPGISSRFDHSERIEAVSPSPGRWPTSPQRGRGAEDERPACYWLYVAKEITVRPRPFWGEGRGEGAGEMPAKPGGSLRSCKAKFSSARGGGPSSVGLIPGAATHRCERRRSPPLAMNLSPLRGSRSRDVISGLFLRARP